jgi:hypothetical protein
VSVSVSPRARRDVPEVLDEDEPGMFALVEPVRRQAQPVTG